MKIKYLLIIGLLLTSILLSGCYTIDINEDLICKEMCDGEYIFISDKYTVSPDVHCTSGNTNLSYASAGHYWSGLPVGVSCD